MLEASSITVNGRYRLIRQIGSGGMGIVYEALDRLTGESVALKRMSPGGSSKLVPASGSIPVDTEVLTLHLAREFQLLASLRHPHIISVLDYGIELAAEDGEPRLYYTMELLRESQSIIAAAQTRPVEDRIRLLVELFEALVYLHRRGILHCDLKPANVLVSENGAVKVVDFGLSSLRQPRDQEDGVVETGEVGPMAGTLSYMAPELLRGGRPSESSDLYAAGLIAFEVLSGRYPFDETGIHKLIRAILDTEPDLTPLYALTLPIQLDEETVPDGSGLLLSEAPTLQSIIRKLLAKRASDRYDSAHAVIADLASAGLPVGTESREVRESFLQAAQFVGRSTELERLRTALSLSLDGKGSAWLVGGESGIGKSRLLNELRTYALISGAQVLTGQAVEGGGLSYQVWRSPLRRLALTTSMTDLEAGVLKDLIPDIDRLLERPIPDAPPLDGRSESQRMRTTILDLFRKQITPTVLLLEDLHWARESLDALRTILPLVQKRPMLIVGTYRLEEGGSLPAELPGMTTIRLNRLNPQEIIELSASMLGANAVPHLTKMLRQETEGNVLFIIEVVRSMAEEAGTLKSIGEQTLPFRDLAGGIQAVLRRRLRRIPAQARPLLDAAAIIGRLIDQPILEAICRANPELTPATSIDAWLLSCSEAAVLEVFDGQWRFSHDKLREVLNIDLMERGDLPRLSEIVALSIEAVYPDGEARASRAAVLADHWRNAGNADREAAALELAAQVALNSALNDQALELIARARVLVKGDSERTGRLMALLTEAYYNLGNLDKCSETGLATLASLGYSLQTEREDQRKTLPALLRQWRWRRFRSRFARSDRTDTRKVTALKILERLTMVHYFRNSQVESAYFSLYGANIAEQVDRLHQMERARGYTSAAVSLGSSRQNLAREFRARADRAIDHVGDVNTIMWHTLGTGILSVIFAEWDEAEKRLRKCIEIARAAGNIRRIEEGCVTLAGAYYYQSRWEETREINAELHTLAERYNDPQALGWALDNLGRFALRQGRLSEARGIFQRGFELYTAVHDQINSVWCLGSIAKSYLGEGDLDSARDYAERVTAALRDVPQTSFGMTEPFSASAEYYLTLWERERSKAVWAELSSETDEASTPSDSTAAFAGEARAAVAALGRYAEVFVIARPRYYAFLGWQRRLDGDLRDAVRCGSRAVSEAIRLKMPYDEAVSSIELARHFPRYEPRREAALNRASDILTRLGAAVDLGRAQRLLYNPDEI